MPDLLGYAEEIRLESSEAKSSKRQGHVQACRAHRKLKRQTEEIQRPAIGLGHFASDQCGPAYQRSKSFRLSQRWRGVRASRLCMSLLLGSSLMTLLTMMISSLNHSE